MIMFLFCSNSTSDFPFTFRKNIVLAQAAITNQHRQGGLNKKHVFLIVLEAEKSKIKGAGCFSVW